MKKFSVLIALALLAVAGTGYAVTCAYDNVPAATLLVPHFRVARQGSTGGDIPETAGVDTLCAVTNVSSTGLIVHVTVWNKYSKAVLDFNVPLTGFDVAFWRMRDILNGHLNVNINAEDTTSSGALVDVCGQAPAFGQYDFIRFLNPSASDASISVSIYNDPAFSGSFRTIVWDSLDETRDITGFTPFPLGTIDTDNPACGVGAGGTYSDDFGGYLTLDVVNYCTNWFPDQSQFYTFDAIATSGWNVASAINENAIPYTPNAIIGDVFYLDPSTTGGNISGDPMVALEFDTRLNNWANNATFFGRYRNLDPGGDLATPYAPFSFAGDGREPLGHRYGFRYLADAANSLTSWAIVWRSDNYVGTTTPNLCPWLAANTATKLATGFVDNQHIIIASTYDNDENVNSTSGGPSGGPSASQQYVFLESQRIALAGNSDINPGNFKSGWIDLDLPGSAPGGIRRYQAYVGIQHSGPGLAISVGHSAANLDAQFNCSPLPTYTGTIN